MENITKWACAEIKGLMPEGLLEDEDIRQMVENCIYLESAEIDKQVSSLLDYSRKEVKKFIQGFIDRVENQRKYEEKVAQSRKNTTTKQYTTQNKQQQARQRDISRVP